MKFDEESESCPGHQPTGLLGEVGARTEEPGHAWALRTLVARGLALPEATARNGTDLLTAARSANALVTSAKPLDLAIFDNGELIGVVVSVCPGGLVEFVYTQRGVVRRGLVSPATPHVRRDRQGRARNTFVRPFSHSDKRGQKYLAGELLSGFISMDKLLPITLAGAPPSP